MAGAFVLPFVDIRFNEYETDSKRSLPVDPAVSRRQAARRRVAQQADQQVSVAVFEEVVAQMGTEGLTGAQRVVALH